MMPLALDSVDDSLQNFYWAYKANTQNSTYDNIELKLPMATFIAALDIPQDGSGWIGIMDDGFAFHYIIDSDSTSYFSYIITQALFNALSHPNISIPAETWYKKITEDNIVSSSEQELNTLRSEYDGTVLIRNFPLFNSTSSPIPVNTINHPTLAFYTKDSIWNFLSDNNAFENNENLYLCVSNGAIRANLSGGTPSIEDDFKVQTPVFYIKDTDTRKLNNTMYVDVPYSNKGLDIATLCPPQCG